MRADLALWPIVFTVTADDLETLQRQAEAGSRKIQAFLAERIPGDEVSVSAPRVTDREGQFGAGGRPVTRYAAETTVTLRTVRIDDLRPAMEASGDLVKPAPYATRGRGTSASRTAIPSRPTSKRCAW